MLKVHDRVVVRVARCACVGGGFTEEIGTIIQVVTAPNGNIWYKISHPNGINTVKETDIIKVLS